MNYKKIKSKRVVKGNFKNLDLFSFEGVYILRDSQNKIVYVGSSYGRTIKERLQQYLRKRDTGNTLGRKIAKQKAGAKKFDAYAQKSMNAAIEEIKSYSICAIKYQDLEYWLIKRVKPKYNKNGKKG